MGGAGRGNVLRTQLILTRLPLHAPTSFSSQPHATRGRVRERTTYANHKITELPAFLVTSIASSSPTGRIVIDAIPISANIANKPPASFGFAAQKTHAQTRQVSISPIRRHREGGKEGTRDSPAQMMLSHSPPSAGHRILHVSAMWWVSTLSKSGEVTADARRPAKSSVAPSRPETSSE